MDNRPESVRATQRARKGAGERLQGDSHALGVARSIEQLSVQVELREVHARHRVEVRALPGQRSSTVSRWVDALHKRMHPAHPPLPSRTEWTRLVPPPY